MRSIVIVHGLIGLTRFSVSGEVLMQEVKDHITTLTIIVGIHSHLSEKIFYLRIDHSQSAKAIPKIIKRKIAFAPAREDWYSSLTNERPSSMVLGRYSLMNLSENWNM